MTEIPEKNATIQEFKEAMSSPDKEHVRQTIPAWTLNLLIEHLDDLIGDRKTNLNEEFAGVLDNPSHARRFHREMKPLHEAERLSLAFQNVFFFDGGG